MNGVLRGGVCTRTGEYHRSSGYRFQRVRTLVNSAIGFRLNGVMRGGRYSREASYILSGYRNGVNKRYGVFVDLGFRLR